MKCSTCSDNLCEGKYVNRELCVGDKEGIECNCVCKITKKEAFYTNFMTVGSGVATAAAGIGIGMASVSLAPIVAGAAVAGAGVSLIFLPFQKQATKECITLKESVKDAAIGATIGAVTGPIGYAGSAIKASSTVVRVGAQILAGSTAGAASGAVTETARFIQGEEVTAKSVAKSMAIGAVVGTVAGASSQVAKNVAKPLSNGVLKATTRVVVQGGSAAVTDAGIQLAQTGTIDTQQLILNTKGQFVVATTGEITSCTAKRINSANNNSNKAKQPKLSRRQRTKLRKAEARKVDAMQKIRNAVEKAKEAGDYIVQNKETIQKASVVASAAIAATQQAINQFEDSSQRPHNSNQDPPPYSRFPSSHEIPPPYDYSENIPINANEEAGSTESERFSQEANGEIKKVTSDLEDLLSQNPSLINGRHDIENMEDHSLNMLFEESAYERAENANKCSSTNRCCKNLDQIHSINENPKDSFRGSSTAMITEKYDIQPQAQEFAKKSVLRKRAQKKVNLKATFEDIRDVVTHNNEQWMKIFAIVAILFLVLMILVLVILLVILLR